MFLWRGVGSTEEEMAAAQHVTSFLGGERATVVSEGKEPGGCCSLTPGDCHNKTCLSDDRIYFTFVFSILNTFIVVHFISKYYI